MTIFKHFYKSLLFALCIVSISEAQIISTNPTKVEDLSFGDEVYTASAMDEILSNFSKGSGFPLTNNADFADFGASNVHYIAFGDYPSSIDYPTNSLYLSQDGKLMFNDKNINTNTASGTLKYIWGPVAFTNQNEYATATNAERIGLMTVTNENANMVIQFNPETGTYEFKATGGVPGPQGPAGIGNIEWAGTWYQGMFITNSNTWVSWNGTIWTRPPSEEPIVNPPTNDAPWSIVVAKGADGESGKDGKDGLDLQLTYWSTNLITLEPDMLLNYAGYLLVITNKYPIPNPGMPIYNGVVDSHYRALVYPGANGATSTVYTNASIIVEFNPLDAVPSNSLVVYDNYLWYAKKNYDPTNPEDRIPPSEGPNWMILGRAGPRGPQGANGIGNLRYVGAWDSQRTNSLNDVMRWVRPSDGRIDWYRAKTDSFVAGNYPRTNQWDLEISSGTDANSLDWKIVDGPYNYLIPHSNELYRAQNGIVYYTTGPVEAGEIYGPGQPQGYNWSVFVKDGTTLTGITNGTTNIVWRGVWNESIDYNPGDMVTYQSSIGAWALYVNYESCNSIAPPNINYWTPITTGLIGATGPQGPKGEDGAITYVTNVTTYSNAMFITNITYITNDSKTAILNSQSLELLPTVKFSSDDFAYSYNQGTFSLTESALGVHSLNSLMGDVMLSGAGNISIIPSNYSLIISNSIPIGLNKGTNAFTNSIINVEKLLFNSDSGFRFVTNANNDIVISLGSSWTAIYDDVGGMNSPTGEEPLRLTTHDEDNLVKWSGTTNIVIDGENTPVKVLSIGTYGHKGDPGEQGPIGPVGPAGTNATLRIGNVASVNPISSNQFGIAYVHMTNEADNTYALYFGIPDGLQGEVGPKGDNGATLVPKGSWSSTNTYYTNEMVRYGNAQYYVINDNDGEGVTGVEPDLLGNTNWFVFVQDGEGLAVNATTLFAFNEHDEAIYYVTNVLLDTNTLMVVQTNVNNVEYSALTVVGGGNANATLIIDGENEYPGPLNIDEDSLAISTVGTNNFLTVIGGKDEQWEIDMNGNIMPSLLVVAGQWEYDDMHDIMPPPVDSVKPIMPNTFRMITGASGSVIPTDYIIWMDGQTAGTNQTLILPDMNVPSMTIVVRELGNSYGSTIKRIHNNVTNEYNISGDGDGVVIDWLGSTTNWYWRTY